MSPALAGKFFTTCATWEAHKGEESALSVSSWSSGHEDAGSALASVMRWLPSSHHSVRLVLLSFPLEVRERDCHFPGIPQLTSNSGGGSYQHLSASQVLTINPYSFLLSSLTITLGLIREWIHILGKDGICFSDFVFHSLLQTWFGPLWSHLWYSCIFFWKTWDPFSYRPTVQIFFRSNILLPLFFS